MKHVLIACVVFALCLAVGLFSLFYVRASGAQTNELLERSIRQTRQLYQAEGEIERFVALAEDVHLLEFPAEHYTKEVAEEKARTAYRTHLQDVSKEVRSCNYDPDDTITDSNSCTFPLTCANGAVCIKTEIRMELAYVYDEETTTQPLPDGTTTTVIKYAAKVSKATHHYNTYTITHLTAEGEASG